jgi:hypothetical protein
MSSQIKAVYCFCIADNNTILVGKKSQLAIFSFSEEKLQFQGDIQLSYTPLTFRISSNIVCCASSQEYHLYNLESKSGTPLFPYDRNSHTAMIVNVNRDFLLKGMQ